MGERERDVVTEMLIAAQAEDKAKVGGLLTTLLACTPTSPSTHLLAAVFYAWLGNKSEFLYQYAVSLALDRSSDAPLTAMAIMLAFRGQSQLSTKVLNAGWAFKKVKYGRTSRLAERKRYTALCRFPDSLNVGVGRLPRLDPDASSVAPAAIAAAAASGSDASVASLLSVLLNGRTADAKTEMFASVAYAWLGMKDADFFENAFLRMGAAGSDVLHHRSGDAPIESDLPVHDQEAFTLLRLAARERDRTAIRKTAELAALSLQRSDHVLASIEYQWLGEMDEALFQIAVVLALDLRAPDPYLCISRLAYQKRELLVQEAILNNKPKTET